MCKAPARRRCRQAPLACIGQTRHNTPAAGRTQLEVRQLPEPVPPRRRQAEGAERPEGATVHLSDQAHSLAHQQAAPILAHNLPGVGLVRRAGQPCSTYRIEGLASVPGLRGRGLRQPWLGVLRAHAAGRACTPVCRACGPGASGIHDRASACSLRSLLWRRHAHTAQQASDCPNAMPGRVSTGPPAIVNQEPCRALDTTAWLLCWEAPGSASRLGSAASAGAVPAAGRCSSVRGASACLPGGSSRVELRHIPGVRPQHAARPWTGGAGCKSDLASAGSRQAASRR